MEQLHNAIGRVLPEPVSVTSDHSWATGRSLVLEVRDGDGVTWFVKQHREADTHRAELHAYRSWVPAFGDRAPRLHASLDDAQALVLSALPGRRLDVVDEAVHRDAGALLRRFHESEDLGQWEDMASDKESELDRWIACGAGALLEPRQLQIARTAVRELGQVASPVRVPCHLDYTPRNWLVTGGGVHVIDFEEVAADVWVNDLARLHFSWWPGRPGLRDAFLDGYGRQPTSDELDLMRRSYALTAVRHVVLAHELGKSNMGAEARGILTDFMTRSFD